MTHARILASGSSFPYDTVLVLFLIIGSGLLLGRIRINCVSLGSSGIIFSAVSYAACYPVALILVTISTQLLVTVLG